MRFWVRTIVLLAILSGALWWSGYWLPLGRLAKPTDPAEFWTLVSAFANIAVLVVAVRGLKSLVLTRKGMLTQATRDAWSCAVHRCEEFADEIIPLNVPVLTNLAAFKVPVFVKHASEVQFDPDNKADLDRAAQWVRNLPAGTLGDCVTLLNRLEAWSMYFTNRLADQKIAAGPCAPFFCSMVVQNYAVLLLHRNRDASSGKYPNIVKLFKSWWADIEDEKVGHKEGELLKQLAALQRKGSPSSKLPNPLGTELDL